MPNTTEACFSTLRRGSLRSLRRTPSGPNTRTSVSPGGEARGPGATRGAGQGAKLGPGSPTTPGELCSGARPAWRPLPTAGPRGGGALRRRRGAAAGGMASRRRAAALRRPPAASLHEARRKTACDKFLLPFASGLRAAGLFFLNTRLYVGLLKYIMVLWWAC